MTNIITYILYRISERLVKPCILLDKVSASQPRGRGFDPHMGHDHDSSYDTSTGWFQEADSRVI